MAKLIQGTKKLKSGTSKIVCGRVSNIREGSGKAEGRNIVVSVAGDIWDREKKENVTGYCNATFWNSDKDADLLEGKNQRADMVKKMNLKKGDFIMMSVFESEDGNSTTGYRIVKGSGVLTIPAQSEEDKPLSVILGSVTRTRMNEEKGVCGVTILANDLVKEVGFQTVNQEVSFWNSEKKEKNAENANRLLSPKTGDDGNTQYARVVVVTGEGTPESFERKDGSKGYAKRYGGAFSFDFAPTKKKDEGEGVSDTTPTPTTASEIDDLPEGFEPTDADEMPWV